MGLFIKIGRRFLDVSVLFVVIMCLWIMWIPTLNVGVVMDGAKKAQPVFRPNNSGDVTVRPNDTSLLEPQDSNVVPSLVHYVWFGEYAPFEFHHFLSVKSVDRFIKPEHIVFHCNNEPTGQWWKLVKKSIKSLQIRKRSPPSEIFGNEIILAEHKSDVARIEILMGNGGIYVDTDVIVLKSFDPLRRYECTMGLEYHGEPGRLNNGVIVAAKDARFLRVWFETYHNFTKREWDYHDSIIPYILQYKYPHLIHVEEGTINYPTGKQLDLIYKQRYDWSRNYAIHLWHRLHEFDHGPAGIRKLNTTFGEIARLAYYGNATLLP